MHRKVALLVVCLVGVSVAAVGVHAQTNNTNWTVDESADTVTFEPGDGETIDRTVSVTNNDPNESVSISVSIDGGHTATGPGTLGPGESGEVDVGLDAGGSESATLTISGGGKDETVDYTVETPAYVEISDIPDWTADEGVLRGESRTAQITVSETGGYSGISGMSVSGDTDGLDVSELEDVSVGADGSTTVDVEFTADSSASQGEDIGGGLTLDPNDGYNVEKDVTLDSYVAYPAQFGSVSLDLSQFTFDEPRSVGTISTRTDITVENSGDRTLDFDELRMDTTEFDVEVLNEPTTIDPRSTAEIELRVTAPTSLSEGTYGFDGTVTADSFDVDDGDLDESVQINHGVKLDISSSQAAVGDLPIGEAGSSGLTASEGLGYRGIGGLEMTLVDGQSEWIEVTSGPGTSLSAGDSSTIGYEVQFPPAADIGNEYTWTYRISGEQVETKTVTVSATPIPLNLDPIRNDLESAPSGTDTREQTAQETLSMVNDVDQRIRSNDLAREDLTTTLTFSDSVINYLDAISNASELAENDQHDAAQQELIRAAVAFDTMRTYGSAIQDDTLRNRSSAIRETAGNELDSLLAEQRSHYEEQLAGNDTAPIEEARIKRELARIATLQGDTERAEQLDSESSAAFEKYSNLVAEGEQERQSAIQTWNGMETDIFVSVAGQQFVLNPFQYDAFESRASDMLVAYDNATAAFSQAGESARVQTVTDERAQRESAITIARWSLFGSIAVTVLVLVILTLHTVRGMYWYVQDSKESISGDFLI